MTQEESKSPRPAEKKNEAQPTVTFLREVSAKYSGPRRKTLRIREVSDVKDFLSGILDGDAREHFYALFLDGAHQVVGFTTVSIGTANCTLVHPREVFQPAILAGAVAIIVAHNHPSGDPEPSTEDRRVTELLREAGNLLGIRLLDHVVLAADSYVSFAERGELR